MASTTATATNATATTATLGTSNVRGASRQTRNNPARTSRNSRPTLRQNSLISIPTEANHGVAEPHGFNPAISHFTDAIAALPRDYRRHISLLKEVDAKAWLPEENLQTLLGQCLAERETRPTVSTTQTIAGSSSNAADDTIVLSATNSVNGMQFDVASQQSAQPTEPTSLQRRQLYQNLRMNLMQMMITMDERNHVINNANEDLSRHIRRLDGIWSHISEEISDEARLGSLKHWAYTDLNPPKKVVAASSRREAAAGLAIMVENDIAHRSESRREAMMAKKQRLNQHVDSDFEEKATGRKMVAGKTKKTTEQILEAVLGPRWAMNKGKKPEKPTTSAAMERSVSGLRAGAMAMSREPSQLDNGANNKKRKASGSVATVARKRLNVTQQESPKLASSPLANSHGKDAVKKSPALSTIRPAARGRQNSAQTTETGKNRPSSSYRNTGGTATNIDASDARTVAAATGKNALEVKNTMKQTATNKGDKIIEDSSGSTGDATMRGGLMLERTTSSRGARKDAIIEDARTAPSPRSVPAALALESKPTARGRASKTSTPVIGSFAEADGDDSGGANGSENGNYTGGAHSKTKRVPRPRIKDHHGLQDSLSPRGLPMKRTHTKNASMSSLGTGPNTKSSKPPSGHRPRGLPYPDHYNARSGKPPFPDLTRTKSKGSSKDKPTDEEAEDDDEDEEEITNEDEDEVKYCYCNGVSYGEMVACDSEECPREWFHLECIGLKSLPKSAKWYCDDCKERMWRGKW